MKRNLYTKQIKLTDSQKRQQDKDVLDIAKKYGFTIRKD